MSTLPARRQPADAAPAAPALVDCAICGLQGPPKEMADCAECGAVFHIDLSREELGRSCGAATFRPVLRVQLQLRPLHRALRGGCRHGRPLALGRPLAATRPATHKEARER